MACLISASVYVGVPGQWGAVASVAGDNKLEGSLLTTG